MCIVNAWHPDVARRGQARLDGPAAARLDAARARAMTPTRSAPGGTLGRVAIDIAASPLMWFTGYVGAPEKTAERYSPDGRWYLTGDAGSADADGHYLLLLPRRRRDHHGRLPDRPLRRRERAGDPSDVVECGRRRRAGRAARRGLEAFVVLRDGAAPTDALAARTAAAGQDKFAAHAYPRRCISSTSCRRRPAARSSDTSSASNGPNPPRRNPARPEDRHVRSCGIPADRRPPSTRGTRQARSANPWHRF